MLHHKVVFWDDVLNEWVAYGEYRHGVLAVVIFDDLEAAYAVLEIYAANTAARIVPVGE